MHPLHDHLARQLGERMKARRVVVWYDPRREFGPFIEELRGGPAPPGTASPFTVGDERAHLAEYDGSFFELRAQVEPLVSEDIPEPVLLYLPGVERDRRGSVLMELEKICEADGHLFGQSLKQVGRNVLRQRHTDGIIDEILAPERLTYQDIARAASESGSAEPPSILKSIYHDVSGNDALLAAWLVSDSRDGEIQDKEAVRELAKLVRFRLGLELPESAELPKLRAITLRYVLVGEFRADLRCAAPSNLASIPAPKTKAEEEAVRALARRLRGAFAAEYTDLADRVEAELGLPGTQVPAEALGSIDTFRFEERLLLIHCGELIASGGFDEALALVNERERSFWLDRDVVRKAHWEACRLMAELGEIAGTVRAAMARTTNGPGGWVAAYTQKESGWYRLDQAQRRLETLVAKLEEDPEERALGVVRRAYEDVCNAMVEGFTKALSKADWTVPATLAQTQVWSDVLAGRPKPVAYFVVDALRFEMGVELAERLPKTAEVAVRPAIGALPTITPVGMAALLPGAAGSFSVVEQSRKLGVQIEEAFLADLPARKKHAAAREPTLVDLSLDDLLSLSKDKLKKKIGGAQVIFVRSQEIDFAGETGFNRQARRIMDEVIGDLASALQRLARAGVEHAVLTADHGHLFFPGDRDESMRIASPGGDQIELHRRCWIGRGGATPPGCVRIAASALGYAADLDFIFPAGGGVFKSGGDLAYYHGGPSLQELVIPVLTVRLKAPGAALPPAGPVTVSGLAEAITNRIFSATLELGGQNLSLFSSSMPVRPVLLAGGRQVGAAIVAIEGEFDRATGCVTLQTGKPATVGFQLSDDSIPALRVAVLDPATDAELYRSPADIPVRLGV